MLKIGIDVGSTTAKLVAIDKNGSILFSEYKRHNAKPAEIVCGILKQLQARAGDVDICAKITGSVGMGISERVGIPFVQEVVAATKAIRHDYPSVRSMIDIGGEDAKTVFFKNAEVTDFRMNGNCAGGTGAFIDQMAVLLGCDISELSNLAMNATQIYPIASRCGVFSKTDVQNLIAKNVSKENIAASVFHAIVVQTVVTLAHGCEIKAPVLFCGGPLIFIPALRKAFIDYLKLKDEKDIVIPDNGTLLAAIGTVYSMTVNEPCDKLSRFIARLDNECNRIDKFHSGLAPVFKSPADYSDWQSRISRNKINTAKLEPGEHDVFIGIDSGSTTTKIVVVDNDANILYKYYKPNEGNPVAAVEKGLLELKNLCGETGAVLNIKGSCSTGYGEDLVKAAFQLDYGIVETIAHYGGARFLNDKVSFILDIGGQDMKAVFINNGVINNIEINEACSSGCGSFIETFANTLGYSVHDFSVAACRSNKPCDLGTRCTVFMNSKVKQVLREGATVDDIAAGLAYSVVKNCLYKVLKLKDLTLLGNNIVVQGGTMRNDAVVRALELLTGKEVYRADIPELIGAFGCALYAREHGGHGISLNEIIDKANYSSKMLHCRGCENQCQVLQYRFDNGKSYYSGNRCEKIFTNGEKKEKGENIYIIKEKLLFGRNGRKVENPRMTIGIPRCLNMYENFPFWHTLFTACGIDVCLSEKSDFGKYEQNARMVMSDNICFPAKLVHSHIQYLMDKKVDRIFMPYVVYEKQTTGQNSYNCPVVTGYSDVVKGVQSSEIPIDSPPISFKDKKLLHKQCRKYLESLGIESALINKALSLADAEQEMFERELVGCNNKILETAKRENRLTILLAGRPYHADSLIQHEISGIIAEMGVSVISDDIIRNGNTDMPTVCFLPQWAYPNRILQAAKWCAMQNRNVQFVEMTSFGCGPDAFLVDEIRDLLMKNGKAFTLIKLDDICNAGSMKLRIRSLIASLATLKEEEDKAAETDVSVRNTELNFRDKKILVPYFTPFISPLVPAVMRVAGYDVENLPLSDTQSSEWGLKYANNEVCYPATLIVGDVIKAFKSGKYEPDKCVVVMTQTGGQCRASNYVAIIRKALRDAGYPNTPVAALTFGNTPDNKQYGIDINWIKILPVAIRAILYSDCISKFYYAAAVREKRPGLAAGLKDYFLQTAETLILNNQSKELFNYLDSASARFNDICDDKCCPRVGIVGEIFLKFNPFAHRHIIDWLIENGIEVVPSVLIDFFSQSFVNRKVRVESDILKKGYRDIVYNLGYKIIREQIEEVNRIAGRFRYFVPFGNIYDEAKEAEKVISLNAQFGEGWLLPAEVISFLNMEINDIISLQPFGCIANHIVSKGIENRIKYFFPFANMYFWISIAVSAM